MRQFRKLWVGTLFIIPTDLKIEKGVITDTRIPVYRKVVERRGMNVMLAKTKQLVDYLEPDTLVIPVC